MPYKDRNKKRENNRKWYWENRHKRIISINAWNKANKEKLSEASKKWREENKERELETRRRSYHKRKLLGTLKKYNPTPEQVERRKQTQKERNKRNRHIIREKERERYKNDVNFRMARLLRAALRESLKGNAKKGSAVKNLGCTISELKIYIESLWTEGMNWENYGYSGWHIDHIKLLCSFDLSDPEQLRIACHYTNLQPLWGEENIRKQQKELRVKRKYFSRETNRLV